MIGAILWFNDARRKGCDSASVAGVVVDMFPTLSCWLIDLCCIANIMVFNSFNSSRSCEVSDGMGDG